MKRDFNTLRKNLKKDVASLPLVKMAVLGDASTQFLVQALKGWGIERGYNFSVLETDIGQTDLQVMDPASDLYAGEPEFVIIFPSVFTAYKKFCSTEIQQRAIFGNSFIAHVGELVRTISSRINAKVILANLPMHNDAVFGNFSSKVAHSWIYQQRMINTGLMKLAEETPALYIADVALLQSQSNADVFDARMKVNADLDFSLDFSAEVAGAMTSIALAAKGNICKCVVVDLDNTIWGGVIGDDGIANIQVGDLGVGKAYSNLQRWLKQLKERGILLAVCSKNTEEIALEPFEKHPDMILRREDFAVFMANWETKPDNIMHIQKILNISFDSMVFLDDNPFEREMVRTHVPSLIIPELPEDPAEFVPYLCWLNLFETVSFSEEDAVRTERYREEATRVDFQKSFENESDFLSSLRMECEVKPFDAFSIPRIAQLTQRSNQFNLRTKRYTDAELQAMVKSSDYFTCSFSLRDKFGDYGLISAVILQKQKNELFIDTWIMSCRVLKRGMENFTMNQLVEIAKKNGFTKITGEYLPTPKNAIVSNLLGEMGFTGGNGKQSVDITGYECKPSKISAV